MLVRRNTRAMIPSTMAKAPWITFVKYRTATNTTNRILITLSVIPMFFFIFRTFIVVNQAINKGNIIKFDIMKQMPDFGERLIAFYDDLTVPSNLPSDIKVMIPYTNASVKKVVRQFAELYYRDDTHRVFLFGINPGRHGAGVTGITFTDPVRLETDCGLPNPFTKIAETSSVFIYRVIGSFGGPQRFYRHFFLTALCPLGFTRDGKNLNYYDIKGFDKCLGPYIMETLKMQVQLGALKEKAICLGEGRNYEYFCQLNKRINCFRGIIPLPHPRFIMQYKYREIDQYVEKYFSVLKSCV
jgi:hypothetical protein